MTIAVAWDIKQQTNQFQEEMAFKDISYLEFWPPLCSAEQNHWCNFGRGHYGKQLCDILLNLDQRFNQEMAFKDISYLELRLPL